MSTIDRRRRYPVRMAALPQRMKILAATCAVVLLAGLWLRPDRAWPDLLLGSFAIVGLGLAGLLFVAIQYASGAVWSIALRRVAEAMTAVLPAGAVGILLVLLGHPSLYPWYGHSIPTEGGWSGFKQAWLSYHFFVGRAVFYFAVWLAFARAIRKNSSLQDEQGGWELDRKNTRLSIAFLIAFAITFSLASIDWVMAIEPGWSSTIFGIYHFSGMFVAGLAVIALLAVALRKAGPLRGVVSDEHLLDLGRLILAFSTFWGYIWFSQYMLIWYTNFNDETSYMILRTNSGWGHLFVLNVILNWALPFLILLPRASKMNSHSLTAAACVVVAGRVTDLYLMILAPFAPTNPRPAIWDLAALGLVASLFILLTLRAFFGGEPIPVGDPLLPQSVHGHA
jgi:hypothetical protein